MFETQEMQTISQTYWNSGHSNRLGRHSSPHSIYQPCQQLLIELAWPIFQQEIESPNSRGEGLLYHW